MMRYTIRIATVALMLAVCPRLVAPLANDGIDPEALIERILAVDEEQRAQLQDVTFEATLVEGKIEDKEGFVEEERLEKTIYLKYFPDTVWYHEEFNAYYKDGELQEEKELAKAAKDRREKKKKRKAYDMSYPMLKPFFPDERQLYNITYDGVANEIIDDQVCHKFTVEAKEDLEGMIEGSYYFEAESFHLVRVDFKPAKLVKKTMFKLNQLDMSLLHTETADGFWVPQRFEIEGKGKAALFIGVSFAAREFYRNPAFNTGLPDSLFVAEEESDE